MASAMSCRLCGDGRLQHAGAVEGYYYFECPTCRFAFTPDVDEQALQTLYASNYEGLDGRPPPHGWAPPAFLEPALQRLGQQEPLTILDFGAGQSHLPWTLRQSGHRVVAVDLAPPTQPDPDRLTGCLLELALTPDQFDLSYSFQVFEHLIEPRPYLDELLRLTRPGGYVLIHTDMETDERPENLSDWWYAQVPRLAGRAAV